MEETKVFEEIEIDEAVEEAVEATETSGGGLSGLLGLGILAVGTGIAAWWYNKSGRREAREIKKLEKKGYTVTKAVPMLDEADEDLDDEESDE